MNATGSTDRIDPTFVLPKGAIVNRVSYTVYEYTAQAAGPYTATGAWIAVVNEQGACCYRQIEVHLPATEQALAREVIDRFIESS